MIYDCETYMPLSGNPYLYGEPFGAKELLRLEDEAGVRAALTIAAGYDGSDNRTMREAIMGYPRIIGCSYVDPSRGKAAVDEFRMTVTEWGFKCLKMSPSPNSDDLAKAAADLEVPIMIHTGGESWNPQTKAFYTRIAELAKRYPGMPIIMEHMGYRYSVDLAIEITRQYPNLYLGTTVVAAAEPIVVKRAIQEVGAEKVLFGSNAPWAIPYYGVEGIRRLKLGKEDERLVLGGNFQRIYRLG